MYKKSCFRCLQFSFSSMKESIWICPVCQADLTEVKAVDAELPGERAFSQSNENFLHNDVRANNRNYL